MTQKGLRLQIPAVYRIQVQGYLDGSWSDRLGGLTIMVNSEPVNGTLATTLFGRLRDQTALIGVLNSLYDLHLPLLTVEYLDE
jgi:hypothetical protein